MSLTIRNPRNGCALQGAVNTLRSVGDIEPIIHSTAGCGVGGGLAGRGPIGGCPMRGGEGLETPASNIFEKHVIFGGSSRLREQIKNTVKVVDASLYVVVSGCATEIIGDDIPAMTKEAQVQDFPVIFVNAAGFRGDAYAGYVIAVRGILEKAGETAKPGEKEKDLVNVFGLLPGSDPYLEGEYRELAELLRILGLTVNPLFGCGACWENWKRAPRAALNIGFSDIGEEIVRHAHERFGTDALVFGALPVGPAQTSAFLQAVAEKLRLRAETLPDFVRSREKRFYYHLDRLIDCYVRRGYQRRFALVGDQPHAAGISAFLENELGMENAGVVVTGGTLAQAGVGREPEREGALQDAGEIEAFVRQARPGLLLGSSLEARLAEALRIPFLQVSSPLAGRTVLDRHYAGFSGALGLLEDLSDRLFAAGE